MRVLAAFVLIGALFAGGCKASGVDTDSSTLWQPPPGLPGEGTSPVLAFGLRADDVWVVGGGTIERLLRDDTKAPRHQRFVVRMSSDLTILFAHNIDLAPRVPLKRGDRIHFRGKYVWSKQGGTVHWTHRDKRDKKAGGWIIWKGQNFR